MSGRIEAPSHPDQGRLLVTEADDVVAGPRDFPPHRITVERYERMVDAGVFGAKEPVFLWRGRLVEKMPKGRPHVVALLRLQKLLARLVPDARYVQQEQPIAIADDGMPEPDLAVIRGSIEDHLDHTPPGHDVALIVKVADSSLAVDSGDVLQTYAAQGIPVYWIVNIPGRRIEVHREPTAAPGYRERRAYGPGEHVPVVLDGREVGHVAVDEILP